jgi:hypothetical protein
MKRTIIVSVVLALAVARDATTAGFQPQSPVQGRVQESLVVFEVTEVRELDHETKGPVTIVFANRTFNSRTAFTPLMGDDIVAEFSFSGLDVPKDVTKPFRFSRRVKDTSFLDARFIRIVNQSTDGWSGNTLSIFVDGTPVLNRVSLFPRRKPGSATMTQIGLQACNRSTWATCVYWEEEMTKIRYVGKK